MPMVMDNRFILLPSTPPGVRSSKDRLEGEDDLDVAEGKCLRFTGALSRNPLHTLKRARAAGKGVGLDTEALEDADEQMA